MRFFETPVIFPILFSNLIWKFSANEKTVYLTFDDGPMPGPTDFVLQHLMEFRAKATFFCIGDNIRKFPKTFEQILSGGHSVGNHTYHHLNGWSTSSQKYLLDIQNCDRELRNANPSKLFRPPFGKVPLNHKKLIPGMKVIMWSLLSYDFDSKLDPNAALKKMCQKTKPGSIVVFHDSLKANQNLRRILPPYLEFLRHEGYAMKGIN